MKLTWIKCPCGHRACTKNTPAELGSFYQGSGFNEKEMAVMDKAFSHITEEQFKRMMS